MVKHLNDNLITKEFISHIAAFSAAEGGAMGDPGSLLLLTDEKELYETNLIYDETAGSVLKKFPVIRRCIDSLGIKGGGLPAGWKYTYLGAGNHLFMLDWLDILFYKIIDRNALESEIYTLWIETAVKILDGLASKEHFEKGENGCRQNLNIVPHDAQRENIKTKGFVRKTLSAEWNSFSNRTENIVAIGINPSTAQNGKSDNTVTRLCRFLDTYGFNNVTMLNLFESVSSTQDKINESAETDFNSNRDVFDEADIILIVWGLEGYGENKLKAMSVLMDYVQKLYCIKNPNGKYPAHPSRLAYDSEIIPISGAEDFAACGLHEKKSSRKKYPFEKKSVQTLVKEIDSLLKESADISEMTEEDKKETDAAFGYFDDD